MAVATIHPRLYVTIQYRKDAGNDDGHLGFASPYTKDAAFEKRRATQESWAYGGYGTSFEISDDGSILPTANCKIDKFTLFATKCYPIIVDNIPLEGFEIAKSVRRYGWNGAGNVKWRITDPRGFDLEISSENFASVLSCTTMINGVIQGKCAWGRAGKDNVLLPESSDPFKEAYAFTSLSKNKISLKDIKRGDFVKIVYKQKDTGVLDCTYLGRLYFVSPVDATTETTHTTDLTGKVTDKYVFSATVDNTVKYYCIGKPVIGELLTKAATELPISDSVSLINDAIRDNDSSNIEGIPDSAIMAVGSAADVKALTIELRDEPALTCALLPEINTKYNWRNASKFLILSKDATNWYAGKNVETGGYNSKINSPVIFPALLGTTSVEIPLKRTRLDRSRYHYSSNYNGYNIDPANYTVNFDYKEFTHVKSIWLVCANTEMNVNRIPDTLGYFMDRAH